MLAEHGTFVVGRAGSAHVRVKDARVSRRHAVLRGTGTGWILEDESRTGIFIDGHRVERVRISDAIAIRLADASDGPLVEIAPQGNGARVASSPGEPTPSSAVTDLGRSDGELRPRASQASLPSLVADSSRPGQLRIGRAADNELVVEDDLLVSRHHAEMRPKANGRFELVDLGSSNGTFVNGRRIDRADLEELDVVAIGRHVYRLVETRLEPHVDQGEVSLVAAGLTVRTREGRTLLDDVGFNLAERSFMAIVGPSGAGKTTLLNALTGFRPAERGCIVYGGRDLYADYDELRMRVGFVPQQDVVHETLTVTQALDYAGELRFAPDVGADERHARVDEVIDELGLEGCRDLRVRQLSGGQRRRVAVGLELITKPSLLILDEPTSGLDPGYERSLMELLRSLADGGRTVVVVTHSVQSLRLCDRLLFLAPGGRVAYFGPPQFAPAYFGRDDFQEIFRDLSSKTRDWSGEFRAHPFHERYVEAPGMSGPPSSSSRPGVRARSPANAAQRLGQFWMLTRRYSRVVASDRRNAMLLALQPAVLGLVMMLALPADQLDPPEAGVIRIASRGGLVLLVVMLGMTWLGASNAIREIVREQGIFLRERAVGLHVSGYVASKVVVLGLLTTGQALILVPIAVARQGGPDSGAALPWPVLELVLVGALTGLAAMALALVISSLAGTVDRAMTVLPVVLIVQMLLAMGGVFPDLVDKPVLKQASYVASAQWAFSAAASTVDLDHLMSVDRVARAFPEVRVDDPGPALEELSDPGVVARLWRHDWETWAVDAAALVGLMGAGIVVTGLVLRGRRPEA